MTTSTGERQRLLWRREMKKKASKRLSRAGVLVKSGVVSAWGGAKVANQNWWMELHWGLMKTLDELIKTF